MRIIDTFEKKTVNQLKVLKNVYENDGIINIEKISKKTLLDSKTVNVLIRDILEQVNCTEKLDKMDDYLSVRSKILQTSWVYKLLFNLFLAKEVSIVSFTIKFYISESKLRRKIKQINDILQPVDLKITSRNGYIYIKGSETQIRFLGQQFFWTVFKGGNWPFNELDFNKIFDLFYYEFFNFETTKIKNITVIEWCYTFAINLIRYRHGKEIQDENLKKFNYLFSLEPGNKTNKTYVQKIRHILTDEYYLSMNEQNYFFLIIQAKVQFYMNETCFNKSIQIHKKKKFRGLYSL